MGIKNAKSQSCKHPSKPKPASSSSKSSRSNSVQKIDLPCGNSQAAAQLDANSIHPQSGILEGETGDRILEKEGIIEGTRGIDLPSESVELTAITLHQPWASLISLGKKHYETRSWATDYRGPIAIHAAKKLHEDKSLISLLEIPASEIPLGAVVAIAQLTDCILMDEEFILKQSSFEQYLGLWEVGRYAWKLENVRAIKPIAAAGKQGLWKWNQEAAGFNSLEIYPLEPWNPAEFGELHHVAEANGQLNLLEWVDPEPPEPGDYNSREEFYEAFKAWVKTEEGKAKAAEFGVTVSANTKDWEESKAKELKIGDRVVENLNNPEWGKTLDYLIKYGEVISDIYPGKYEPLTLVDIRWDDGKVGAAQVRFLEKVCDQSTDGSTCVQELEPASPTQESNCGEKAPTSSASGTTTASDFSKSDSLNQSDLPTSSLLTLPVKSPSPIDQDSSQLPPPASPLAMMGSGSEQTILETVSPTCSEESKTCNPTSQLSKTSEDCSIALIPPATNQEPISDLSSTPYPRSGSMRNGVLSAAPTLAVPGEGKDCLLLRSPGALSGNSNQRPPGKNKLETQLIQLGLITSSEVANPEFLEAGYNLPVGWTNPQEQRTALELAQVQAQQLPIAPSLELLQEMEATAIVESPLATPCIGQLPPSDLKELNISPALPALDNIGSFSKDDLLNFAITAHESIAGIERSELELAMRKLNQARIAGTCLTEFKKRCRHGEFGESVSTVINLRTAQTYMSIAENWNLLAEASRKTLLQDGQILGINWARDTIAQNKKSLKSAAPPKDPDGWKTPNTQDQPVVDLVKKALGGKIYLDPCSDSGCNIPATMRYFKWNDGLAKHNIWEKTVFINPPFSDPFPWVERCCFEMARGSVSAAVMLLKAGVISNVGTGELINKYASAICHWRGRINFLNDEGNAVKGSDFDCAFIYFGARLDLFRQAFGGRGTIATIENHYSSVNKKFMTKGEKAEFGNVEAEQKYLAAAVGLGNGKSVLPDMRDSDRERMERYDPHTVLDLLSSSVPTTSAKPVPLSQNLSQAIPEPEIFDETPLATRQLQKAKENCLNDYVTAISSNLSEFSDDQIAFLAKIINEESVKRIGF